MEEEDEDPPLAVEINKSTPPQSQNDDVSVGVTVITGYLGAGKSTVSFIPQSQCLFFFFINFFNGDSSCYHVASIVWNYMNQHFSLNCAVSDMNYMYWFVICFWNTVIVKWWNGVYLKLFALNMIKNGWMGGGFNLLKSLTGALC